MSVAGLGQVVRVPVLRASLRVERRPVAVCAALVVVALLLLVLAVGTGEYSIPPGDVISTLLGGGDPGTQFIVETLRLPRAVTAVLVGASLGAAGAIFQSVTGNPLGSPDIIGFTAGAAAGGVMQIVLFDGGAGAVATAAVVGGLVTAVAVYLLALRDGVHGYRLILIGIGMQAMMVAVIGYLLTRARLEDAHGASVWLVGSLNGRGWEQARPTALGLAVLAPVLFALARPLRVLEMGDETARALGVAVERSRLALILVGVGLTAMATAAAGPVAFLALTAPQIARRLTRAAGPGLVTAALMGAVLLLAADQGSQRLFPSTQLPVGIVTGVLGGIYLIWLLAHEWRGGRT